MTKSRRKYHTGYYTAAQELTGIYRVKPLVGPFDTRRAAQAMIPATRNAALRSEDYHACNIIITEIKRKITLPLPNGALDLTTAVDDEWIRIVTSYIGWNYVMRDLQAVEGGWRG
jgi:hypothetical protein